MERSISQHEVSAVSVFNFPLVIYQCFCVDGIWWSTVVVFYRKKNTIGKFLFHTTILLTCDVTSACLNIWRRFHFQTMVVITDWHAYWWHSISLSTKIFILISKLASFIRAVAMVIMQIKFPLSIPADRRRVNMLFNLHATGRVIYYVLEPVV